MQPIKHNYSGNSADKICHPRSHAYSAQQVLLKKQRHRSGVAPTVAELICTVTIILIKT